MKKVTTKKEKLNEERKEAILTLKRYCKNNQIYAYVTHVSNSGITRDIKVYTIYKGRLLNITPVIKIALELKWGQDYGVRVSGCGMDMIFKVLYDINTIAIYHNLIKPNKKYNKHDLYYNGIVNTNYNMI